MKKLVLLLAVAFSVSMFSCGGGEAGNGVDSDSIKKAQADSLAKVEAAKKAADAQSQGTPEVNPGAPTTPDSSAQN